MNDHKNLVRWFCSSFIATIIILIGYLCFSIITFKKSQECIVNEQLKHIATVDSFFYDIKKVILYRQSCLMQNIPSLLSNIEIKTQMMRLSLPNFNNLKRIIRGY